MFNLKINFLIRFVLCILAVRPSLATTPESKKAQQPVFKLDLMVEPLTLDPTQQKGSGAMYLMNALQLPLFLSDLNNRFKPGILEKCAWLNSLKLSCKLVASRKWSQGKIIESSDVKRTFDYFKEEKTQSLRPDLVQNIKTLLTPNKNTIIFELNIPEPRFQERLTSPLLSPIFTTKFPRVEEGENLVTSGPYKIEKWESKNKIKLAINPYFNGSPKRPPIEFYFISDDTTAMLLYQKQQLDFLRRVPSSYIKSYSSKPEFHQSPLIRFDYLGFGPGMEKKEELRKILSESLQYENWAKVLQALGRPGCFGIGLTLIKENPCLNFKEKNIQQWKNILSKNKLPPLELHFSTLGGEDHKRSMEWVQSEWKKNLDLNISLKGMENSLFQREINETPPLLFRFGVTLEHLSCYNALERFIQFPKSQLPFKNTKLLNLIKQLAEQKPHVSEEPLCRKALDLLLTEHWVIPLGRIHLSFLVRPEWKGWSLSPLNYLDLSELHLDESLN